MRTLHDIGVIFRGELTLAMRNRTGIAIGLVQPFVYLLLFGPLLTQALPAGQNTWSFFVPGLLLQLGRREVPDEHHRRDAQRQEMPHHLAVAPGAAHLDDGRVAFRREPRLERRELGHAGGRREILHAHADQRARGAAEVPRVRVGGEPALGQRPLDAFDRLGPQPRSSVEHA